MIETLLKLDYTPFWVSLKLSFITTLILFILVLPLAYFMAYRDFKGKNALEVLGFYLLVFLSPYSFFGKFFDETFGIRLVFNFSGLVIASCIYSLPFMFQPLVSGFRSLNKNLIEASYSLGKGRLQTLFRVALPSIKPSLLTALVISFAHTMGEFGVVLMIGGSVSDKTKVASIAIYEAVELLDFRLAHIYAGIMLIISFCVLFAVYFLNSKKAKFTNF